jgi:hypothetical protein
MQVLETSNAEEWSDKNWEQLSTIFDHEKLTKTKKAREFAQEISIHGFGLIYVSEEVVKKINGVHELMKEFFSSEEKMGYIIYLIT